MSFAKQNNKMFLGFLLLKQIFQSRIRQTWEAWEPQLQKKERLFIKTFWLSKKEEESSTKHQKPSLYAGFLPVFWSFHKEILKKKSL